MSAVVQLGTGPAVAELLAALGRADAAALVAENDRAYVALDERNELDELTEALAEQTRETDNAESEADRLRKTVGKLAKALDHMTGEAHAAFGHKGKLGDCADMDCGRYSTMATKHGAT